MMFSKLKHAHEVLSDPHKRAIYDCLGEKGLKKQEWEVESKVKHSLESSEENENIYCQGPGGEEAAAAHQSHISVSNDSQRQSVPV